MTDWGMVAIRFALYADLMLLVGLAAFPLYNNRRAGLVRVAILPFAATLTWLALTGLVFSAVGFALSSAAMMGVPFTAIDVPILLSMANETEQGAAWLVRTASLAVAAAALIMPRRQPVLQYASALVCGSVALATLLWSGHAAATEGALGTAHRISDIAHMIAASVWIGGIAAFGLLLAPSAPSDADLRIVARSLADFSRIGTVAVATIGLTGLLNGYAILGADAMKRVQSPYGILLVAKLILFTTMLALAANNRWRLTPALDDARRGTPTAWYWLRISIAVEAAAGAAIIALVAWLGTLNPI